MTKFTQNTTVKISAAILNSRTTSGTLYTAPANTYALVQLSAKFASAGNATTNFTIDGTVVANATSVSNTTTPTFGWENLSAFTGTSPTATLPSILVGPGQVLASTQTSGDTSVVSGVSFINT